MKKRRKKVRRNIPLSSDLVLPEIENYLKNTLCAAIGGGGELVCELLVSALPQIVRLFVFVFVAFVF